MLDPSVLSQLTQLKTDIQASKEYAEGSVAATNGRFGFVRLDDGRDAFLSPDKMDRLLPGDRVRVCLKENDKGKLEADVEKLLSSELERYVGQYRVKGAGHFVVPTGIHFNRWVFIPPQSRKGAKDGDFVIARISRHPQRDGKTQAKVVFKIGQPDESSIEHKYVKAKYELNQKPNDDVRIQSTEIQKTVEDGDLGERHDYSELPFVTIDSPMTLDMDDAIAIKTHDDGSSILYVAIADPGSQITQGSALAKQAERNTQSVYLLGGAVSMLPPALAHYTFSLEEGKKRPALVCEISVAADGTITESTFKKGLICSRHKLNYDQVGEYLQSRDNTIVPDDVSEALVQLEVLSKLRRAYREKNYLILDEHIDYDYNLGDNGKIDNVKIRPRNAAHQIVEEAMVACNLSAGEFLGKNNTGLFNSHAGFREERIGEALAVLKEENVECADINSYDGHLALIKTLAADDELSKLIPPLRRMMQNSELSFTHGPHLGMGVPAYATVTSPIRRFADLYNQWCIHAIIDGTPVPDNGQERSDAINAQLQLGRQADRELMQWLITQYTEGLIGQTAEGKIRIVTQQGFGVRMSDTGIEGFILFPKKTEKKYDAKRMTLEVKGTNYRMEQVVKVKIVSVDMDKRRIALDLAD
ncbi:MAG: exoribonuclease-2 [Flavobacteriales bacterium]|jgi:exoribonuclease-2